MHPARRIAAAAVAALAAALITACAPADHHDAADHAGNHLDDVTYTQQMIPHHLQALEMARLALTKPDASPAISALAYQMRDSQGSEITTMRHWLDDWHAAQPAEGSGRSHDAAGMMTDDQMTLLAATDGEKFDYLWLSFMIRHHQGAVTMSQDLLDHAERPEVADLARHVITAQNEEIEAMKALLNQ